MSLTSRTFYSNQKKATPPNSIPSASQLHVKPSLQNPLIQHVDLATSRKIKRGKYIYTQTAKNRNVYLVKSGSIKLGFLSGSGRTLTKAILLEGDLFSEKSILENTNNPEFAIALEHSEIYVFRAEVIKKLLSHDPVLFSYFINVIGNRAMQIERRLESLVFNDSRTRVISFLVELGDQRGQNVGFEILVRNFMTHQEIANHTATSRQTVTTILNELRNSNILTFNRRRLLIRDIQKLEEAK